jgi:hypothetical protein
MKGRHWGLAILCAMILVAFAYSFWVGAQKSPAEGGPESITN